MNPDVNPDRPATASFPTTRLEPHHQGRHRRASAKARAALEELCSIYWYPLYAFIRRKGNDPDRALDLTQDFFARLLKKDILTRRRSV